jgi:hypothetical protein
MTGNWTIQNIKLTLASLMAAVVLMGMPLPAVAADLIVEDHELIAMAKSAATPAQHAAVAKQYRLRAEALEANASDHEAAARKAEGRPLPPIAHKWPAMYRNTGVEKEKQLAIQARKAAEEARSLAAYHLSRSVESGFGL